MRTGDGVQAQDNDRVSSAETLSAPLHLACLLHDLPPPPSSKARGFGESLEEEAVKRTSFAWLNLNFDTFLSGSRRHADLDG